LVTIDRKLVEIDQGRYKPYFQGPEVVTGRRKCCSCSSPTRTMSRRGTWPRRRVRCGSSASGSRIRGRSRRPPRTARSCRCRRTLRGRCTRRSSRRSGDRGPLVRHRRRAHPGRRRDELEPVHLQLLQPGPPQPLHAPATADSLTHHSGVITTPAYHTSTSSLAAAAPVTYDLN